MSVKFKDMNLFWNLHLLADGSLFARVGQITGKPNDTEVMAVT